MSDKWAFGTGDYTVETWIYKTENQSQAVVANGSTGSANSNHWIMKSKTGFNSQHANINFSHGSGDLITSDSDYDFPLNKGSHPIFFFDPKKIWEGRGPDTTLRR